MAKAVAKKASPKKVHAKKAAAPKKAHAKKAHAKKAAPKKAHAKKAHGKVHHKKHAAAHGAVHHHDAKKWSISFNTFSKNHWMINDIPFAGFEGGLPTWVDPLSTNNIKMMSGNRLCNIVIGLILKSAKFIKDLNQYFY